MKINWFTVIAQVINFLILVWLLKRFLYKPILNAIDEREKKIISQLKDAEAKEEKAEKEKVEFKQKNDTFDLEKKELMDKTIAETNVQRQKLLDEARTEANKLSSKLEETSKENRKKLNQEIAKKTQQEVFAIARKTLADLASVSLEEQSVNIFVKRIEELTEEEKKKFIEAFKATSKPILIQSTFELPHKQQIEIKKSIQEILGAKTHFEFKTAPELISGIELMANGYKLAWSISEYLDSMEKDISEILKEKSKEKTEKKPETKTKHDVKEDTDEKIEPKKKVVFEKKAESEKK